MAEGSECELGLQGSGAEVVLRCGSSTADGAGCVRSRVCVLGSCKHLAAAGEAGRGWETGEPFHGCRAPWNVEAPSFRDPKLGTGSGRWGGWAVPSCNAVSWVLFFFPRAE